MHHSSRSHFGLQVADYCCWAVFRKWEQGDTTHFDRIPAELGERASNAPQGDTPYV